MPYKYHSTALLEFFSLFSPPFLQIFFEPDFEAFVLSFPSTSLRKQADRMEFSLHKDFKVSTQNSLANN